MPANLPPEYFQAEKRYRQAKSPQEKITALEEMLMIMPKHKGTDKLRAALRRKIARFKDILALKKYRGKRGVSYYIDKEGAGQVAIIGLPNVGKSSLLRTLTRARPEVADYPFTTRIPTPGMMDYEDISIQLIDTPPLSEFAQPWFVDMLKRADVLLIMLDLTEDVLKQWEETLNLLRAFKIILKSTSEDVHGLTIKKALVALNKKDMPGAEENFAIFKEFWDFDIPLLSISAKKGENLDLLGKHLYMALEVIRVYSKPPGKRPDLKEPYILEKGSTVLDLAERVHKEIAAKLKFARIWNERAKGLRVEKNYVLLDKDIVELRT